MRLSPCGILIVEDHAATARLLEETLSEAFCDKLVKAVGCAEELFAIPTQQIPSVVVMDISLRGINGIEATRRLKRIAPKIAVLIHSNLEPAIYSEECMRAGASAYVRKAQPVSELVAEVARLLSS